MKESDLLYGLLRSFKKPAYSFSDIEYLTTPFRISETCLRNNLSRMVSRNILIVTRQGRKAFYAFTARADKNGKNVAMTFRTPDWSGWQEDWWGISLSVPDESRKERYRLIRKLSYYRFAALHPGFWIRPYHEAEDLENQLRDVMANPCCKTIQFRFLMKSEWENIPKLWKVNEIQKRFMECANYLIKSRDDYDLNNPRDALRGMMILGNVAVKQLASDPMLPEVFLPSDWAGINLRKVFMEWTRLTFEKSKPYWKRIYQEEEQNTNLNPEPYENYHKLAT